MHIKRLMAWEDIEERLKRALPVSVAFPSGTVRLPETHLTVEEWLASLAVTDEEFQELTIPRMEFLRNRYPVQEILSLEWDGTPFSRRALLWMPVGRRAYILLSGWSDCQVIASIEPGNDPVLMHAVSVKILESPGFAANPPARIRNRRPDLLMEPLIDTETDTTGAEKGIGATPVELVSGGIAGRVKYFLTEILFGWIGRWLSQPESIYLNQGPEDTWAERPGTGPLANNESSRGKRERGTVEEGQAEPPERRAS